MHDLGEAEVKQLITTWYKKDWNSLPPVYALQPVSTYFPQTTGLRSPLPIYVERESYVSRTVTTLGNR